MPSNAEIDRLGMRFQADPSDLLTLSELFSYCADVGQRTQHIISRLKKITSFPITPRDGKSFISIRQKLDRGTLKLSAMQDIEGCRIIVDSLLEQDALIFRLCGAMDDVRVYDRRKDPSSGYRAVHAVIRANNARYEVQVRTTLQHSWAEVSERLAAKFGQELQYGEIPNSTEGQAAQGHVARHSHSSARGRRTVKDSR